jgi:hypothetical protein
MQIGERKLTPSSPFCGVTNRKTLPLGQIELPVLFGGRDNFHTESIMFDVAHFDLPYNAILGRPVLAKFMAAVHYAYSVLKIPARPGSSPSRPTWGGGQCTVPSVPLRRWQPRLLTTQIVWSHHHALRQSSAFLPTAPPSQKLSVSGMTPRK